jgi:pilus assembly protein CpaE
MLINGPEPVITAVPEAAQVRDSSQARLPCLAFVADDDTEAALRSGLLNIVEGVEVRQGTILHAVKHLTKSPTPRALIVDISKVASPLVELDNLARVCTPDVKLMVVGEDENISFYRELRNMGVAEYMHKPLTRSTVTRVFAPQIAGAAINASVARGGSVIAVCGARGGVGATTVAVNLALQLAGSTRGHVALLDLQLQKGTTALMLGVKPVSGLRIALEQPERADALFLDRVCLEISERLRLVAAEEGIDEIISPTSDGILGVMDLLRKRFNYVVIDAPAPDTLTGIEAMRLARHLLVVMTPDLASVRDADRLRQLATRLNIGSTTVVLNRLGMPGGLTMPMIEQGLGQKPGIQIPELGRQLARAANLGKPALNDCTPFRKAIALLAQDVSGAAQNRPSRSGIHGLFGMAFGR